MTSAEYKACAGYLTDLPQLSQGRDRTGCPAYHHGRPQLNILLHTVQIGQVRHVGIYLFTAKPVCRLLHHIHIVFIAHIQEYGAGSCIQVLFHILQAPDPSSRQYGLIHGAGCFLDSAYDSLVVLI